MTRPRGNRRPRRAVPQNVPRPPPLGEIEPERPPPLSPRVVYRKTFDPSQPIQIFVLVPGERNPMPGLPIWDHNFFYLQSETGVLLDHQIWAAYVNRGIPHTLGNLRYMAQSCWERGMNAEQTRFHLKAVIVQTTDNWPMDFDEIYFWFRRFARGNENLEVHRSIEDLMMEEVVNWEELSKIKLVFPEPYVNFAGGPLNHIEYESNRFDIYVAWMSYGKRMPDTVVHRRYAISLAFQHRYTVKRARDFLWGLWGVPEDEKYPVETDEIEFWYRRFQKGHFRDADFEWHKSLEELKIEEQGWLAIGCAQPFDWFGHYYMNDESRSEIWNYNETARNKFKLVFRVSDGIAEQQDRNAPDSYWQNFLRRLPTAAPNQIQFDRPNRLIRTNQ